jgi:hypothetical protein
LCSKLRVWANGLSMLATVMVSCRLVNQRHAANFLAFSVLIMLQPLILHNECRIHYSLHKLYSSLHYSITKLLLLLSLAPTSAEQAMGQDTEESRFDSWQGEDNSSPETRPVLGLTQTPIQWVSRALSTGGKAKKFYFHPSSSEVKNEWSSTSTRPYAFMVYTSTRNLPLLH